MSEELEARPKFKEKESVVAYKATLYRSAFAIRLELQQGLIDFIQLSGSPSVSRTLSMIAQEPETFAALLKPEFDRLLERNKDPIRRRHKVTIKAVVEQIRSGNMSPDEIEEALMAIKARKLAEGKT